MTKDSIKISQEINFNGMPTWVSIGATLLPEDNVIESLKSLQKDITEYQQSEESIFGKSKFSKVQDIKPTKEPVPLVEQINSCTELKVLESYRLIAKANPETQTAYDNTLNRIQNG